MLNCPVVAFDEAPKITEVICPAITKKGLAGLLVTPAGTPVRVICTLPENPFSALTETVTGALALPCATLSVAEETAIEKSG
jgi:hypothetical protein